MIRVAVLMLIAVLAIAPAQVAAQEPARVFTFTLDGSFGKDISQTPIREAMEKARQLQADYVIIKVDNDWFQFGDPLEEALPDDEGNFDQFFRTKVMRPIFDEELEQWDEEPRIVFWVKNAMGGAAFLPFMAEAMYFHPEGRIGGIGGVFASMEGVGDRVVVEKQVALRLSTAKGVAIASGYEPRLIEAMARGDYVLSYELVGGRPEYHERMPAGTHEVLLTNDASLEQNADTIQMRARGEGRNYLTLKADTAQTLNVSRGTVETLDDLLFELGIARNHEIVGSGDDIMDDWSDGIERSQEQLTRLWREFTQIQVEGDWTDRRRARGQQRSKLEQMMGILRRYEESIVPYEFGFGFGNASQWMGQLRLIIQRIQLQQLADERD
ncbi:MAG: hypothetical protein AAFX79_04820 [Planctomycetota bacterium]